MKNRVSRVVAPESLLHMPADGSDIRSSGLPTLSPLEFNKVNKTDLSVEGNFSRKASNLIPLFGNYICEDGVRALCFRQHNRHCFGLSRRVEKHTGRISLGKSTSLVNFISPFFSGHSRSAFPIVSQPSACWLMSVMRPYLTWRCIMKPSPTSFLKSPVAVMESFSPLDFHVSRLPQRK